MRLVLGHLAAGGQVPALSGQVDGFIGRLEVAPEVLELAVPEAIPEAVAKAVHAIRLWR